MRLRVEFTTEPFDLEQPPRHALADREVIEQDAFDHLGVRLFGTTAEGAVDAVVPAGAEPLPRTLGAGVSRVSLQVDVIRDGEGG